MSTAPGENPPPGRRARAPIKAYWIAIAAAGTLFAAIWLLPHQKSECSPGSVDQLFAKIACR